MSPEKQRIAIAEACGWRAEHYTDNGIKYTVGYRPNGTTAGSTSGHNGTHVSLGVPDYLNDLNAMHEAEKVITKQEWPDYTDHLFHLVTDTPAWAADASLLSANQAMVHASAAQRAEAFLRTLGKWEDDE